MEMHSSSCVSYCFYIKKDYWFFVHGLFIPQLPNRATNIRAGWKKWIIINFVHITITILLIDNMIRAIWNRIYSLNLCYFSESIYHTSPTERRTLPLTSSNEDIDFSVVFRVFKHCENKDFKSEHLFYLSILSFSLAESHLERFVT